MLRDEGDYWDPPTREMRSLNPAVDDCIKRPAKAKGQQKYRYSRVTTA
jgi:hypothetical protein